MKFYLGTHLTGWLGRVDFPLFVSHRRLARVKRLRPAACGWALDSGGFTELSSYGEWRTSPQEYVQAVARYARGIGRLEWAAPQDWMCEPFIVARTGLSVAGHQQRTIESVLQLRELWPSVSDGPCPFVPVLQGWTVADYLSHAGQYAAAGISLADCPLVGVGSVCRRQGTAEISHLVERLTPQLRLHAFGVKTRGLAEAGWRLASADSMAWSYNARRHPPMAGHAHKSCANCLGWAERWREDLLAQVARAAPQDCLALDWRAA